MKINSIINFSKIYNSNIQTLQTKSKKEQDNNNNNKIGLDSLKGNLFSSIKLSFKSKPKVPVYVIDKDGSCKKFASQKEAAAHLDSYSSDVSQAARKGYTIKGKSIVKASEIEQIDKDGNIVVDKDKIKEIIKNSDKRLYAIKYNGEYKECSSQKEAREFIGCDKSNLRALIYGTINTLNGYTVIKASEAETLDDKGETVIDVEKIEKIARNIDKRIYIISKEGVYRQCSNQSEAAQIIGTDPSNVSAVLNNRSRTIKGFFVIKASDIETKDKEGRIVTDEKKLSEIMKNLDKNIYVFNQYGEYKKFASRKEAAQFIGCNICSIGQVLNGSAKTINGYSIVRASEVEERNQAGTIKVDEEKIKELSKKINRGVYVISQDGTYKKYSTPKETSRALNISAKSIINVLAHKAKTTGGFRMVRAADIETLDNNGNVAVDEEKLREILSKR